MEFDALAPIDMPGTKRKKPVARKNCQICIRDLPYCAFARVPTTAACTHERNLCRACLRQWIDARLHDGQFSDIKCPGADCEGIMTAVEIQRLISPPTFSRYQNFAWRAQMNAEPRWRWCPATRCGAGAMRPDKITPSNATSLCKICGVKTCLLCDRMHEDESCAEFLQRTETVPGAEKASESVLKKTTKICPNKECSSRVMKISGCDHMTCSKCRQQFCWECLALWKRAASGQTLDIHEITCMHYRGREDREFQFMADPQPLTEEALVQMERFARGGHEVNTETTTTTAPTATDAAPAFNWRLGMGRQHEARLAPDAVVTASAMPLVRPTVASVPQAMMVQNMQQQQHQGSVPMQRTGPNTFFQPRRMNDILAARARELNLHLNPATVQVDEAGNELPPQDFFATVFGSPVSL